MIDWKKQLTLCWCGYEFETLAYRQPYLLSMAETINDLHMRTHFIEQRTEQYRARKRTIDQLMARTFLPDVDP